MTDSKLPTVLFLAETFPFDLVGGSPRRWASTILTLTQAARVHLLCFQTEARSSKNLATILKQFAKKLPLKQREKLLKRLSYNVITAPQIDVSPGKRFQELLKNFWLNQPFLLWQYNNQDFQQKFLELLHTFKPTVVHVGHLRLAQFLPSDWLSHLNSRKKPRLIYEAQNVEWELIKTQADFLPKLGRWRWWWQREVGLTKTFEKKVARRVDHIFTLSAADVEKLLHLIAPTKKINSFVSYWPIAYPVIDQVQPAKLKLKKSQSLELIFVGNLNWLPNADAIRWFLAEIWPSFSNEFPTARLTIIGQPCSYLSLNPTVAAERVKFLGFVSNLDKLLHSDQIFILPFRMGGGVRLKALTAAWHGIPMVGTPLGIQGLELKTEKNCLVGDTKQHFLHQLTRLAYDPKLRKKLSAGAQQYVRTKHSKTLPKNFWKHYFGKTI